MKVVCIDDSNKPSDIPTSAWITKDQVYTVTDAFYGMDNVPIVQIAERDLTKYPPYKGFHATRFLPISLTPATEDESFQYA